MDIITGKLMNWLSDNIVNLSQFSRSHILVVSLTLTAVLLVYAGKPVLSWGCRWMARLPWLLKFPASVIFNIGIIGLVIFYVPTGVGILLNLFNDQTLAPVLLVILLSSGMFADRYG